MIFCCLRILFMYIICFDQFRLHSLPSDSFSIPTLTSPSKVNVLFLKPINSTQCCECVHGCGTIYCMIGSLSRLGSPKNTDSPSSSSHQLQLNLQQAWDFVCWCVPGFDIMWVFHMKFYLLFLTFLSLLVKRT